MATFPKNDVSGPKRRRLLPLGLVCLALGLALLATVPGCGGCRKDPRQLAEERKKKEAEERAKKKEKPKPDFEVSRLMARPTSSLPPSPSEPLGAAYKPGHWTATTLEAKANNFAFVGDLEIVATDGRGKPILLEGAPFNLTTICQVSLGERQRPKPFESILFVPPTHQLPTASCRLKWRKGGRRAWPPLLNLLSRMPPYQYHFVVIARLPENYAFLKGLTSVKPPSDSFGSNPTKPYYRVALIRADKPDPRPRVSLPSYGLLWTSVACVLWDDAEPEALDPLQQDALLDWLHWGGQLILSGPDSLDKLSDGFLAPYLPATAGAGARQLSQDDFQELYQWSGASGKSAPPLMPAKAWTGVKLQAHPEAQFLPGSGKLLVERRVGRGRIVVSAFALSSRALRSWPGMDEVLSAFLLRRPPRKLAGKPGEEQVQWTDGHAWNDAGRISNLRYFSRDLQKLSPAKKEVEFGTYLPTRAGSSNQELLPGLPGWDNSLDWDGPEPWGPGVAGWNDFNAVANSARTTLKDAAEIEIPERGFVVWVVAGYLLVLVPVNWAVFRLINRVEWAWAAAPAIAVACTVVVIHMARLDIGFVRKRTEITVVELQADYPRAHVTRYTALYTSLTTGYTFYSEDPGTLVLPFSELAPDRLGGYVPQDTRGLLFRRGTDVSLTGFSVQSNSTGMIHSEQMVDLGGGLSLVETHAGRVRLVNRTDLTLRDVGVVKKDKSNVLWTALLDGPLESGATVRLAFRRYSGTSGDPLWKPQQGGTLLQQTGQLPDQVSLIEAAQDVGQLGPGEVRLVAWLEQQIPGLQIRPAAPQTEFATLVVAHLKYGFGEDPQPDLTPLDVGPGAGFDEQVSTTRTPGRDDP
jgi:hypothetical protein